MTCSPASHTYPKLLCVIAVLTGKRPTNLVKRDVVARPERVSD